MNRRNLLGTLATSAVAALAAEELLLGAKALAVGNTSLVASISKCVETGLICSAHCDDMLAKGNKDMAACKAAVSDMLATCQALQRLAVRNSPHTKDLGKVAAAVCADCAKACEAHAKTMEICKNCRDACMDCEKACQAA